MATRDGATQSQADAIAEIGELKTEMAAVRDELTAIREVLDCCASAGGGQGARE